MTRARRPTRAWLALGVGLVSAAAVTGTLLAVRTPSVGVLYGLPDPGAMVNAGLPAARVIAVGAAAVTVGNLLLAAVLAPGDPYGTVSPEGYGGLRAARWWATAQAVASLAVTLLTVAENTGKTPGQLLSHPAMLIGGATQLQQATGWMVAAGLSALTAMLACAVLSWRGAVGLLALALASLAPVTLTTATYAERSHDIAGDAVTLHALGALLWVGSTVAVVVHLARGGAAPVVLRRHGTIATWSLLLVGASGLVTTALAVAPADLLTSAFGLLVVASAAALLVLALLGHCLRAAGRARPGLAGAPGLAALELLLLAGAASAGTGLTRLFPPSERGYVTSRLVYLLGYELPSHLTALDLVVWWRWDVVFGTLAVLAAASYLLAVRRLHRSGREWPAGRTAAWLGGCAVLLVATSSGVGTYAPAVFSVHMVQHMLLATLIPVLLILGHGVTLTLAAVPTRTSERLVSLLDAPVVRGIRHPALAWTAVALTLFGLYPTGLFGAVLQDHWAHLAMTTAFLGTGLALFWPVLGHSLPGRGLPPVGRIVMVFAVMALHAAFSAWLLSRATPVAEAFYASLRLPFVPDLLTDQRRGAVLGWALGELPVVITVLALVMRWTRADRSLPDPALLEWAGPRPEHDEMTYPDVARASSATGGGRSHPSLDPVRRR
ncbi:MAG: cytochrome c oxidase assembly protein [Pseudonocardiaceae bacterium]